MAGWDIDGANGASAVPSVLSPPHVFPSSPSNRCSFLPRVVRAYFTFDEAVLKEMCREAALAQATTFHKARETGNLGRLAGTVLSVSKVELFKAQTLEAGTPVIVLSALVQYIHCARNKKVSARREGGGWERGRQGPVPPRHAPHPISTPPLRGRRRGKSHWL
jgi:hypothetical protein